MIALSSRSYLYMQVRILLAILAHGLISAVRELLKEGDGRTGGSPIPGRIDVCLMAALHAILMDLYKKSRCESKTFRAFVGRNEPDGGLGIYVAVETERLLTLALVRRRVYPGENELTTILRKFPVRASEIDGTRQEFVDDHGRHWIKCRVSLDRAIPV